MYNSADITPKSPESIFAHKFRLLPSCLTNFPIFQIFHVFFNFSEIFHEKFHEILFFRKFPSLVVTHGDRRPRARPARPPIRPLSTPPPLLFSSSSSTPCLLPRGAGLPNTVWPGRAPAGHAGRRVHAPVAEVSSRCWREAVLWSRAGEAGPRHLPAAAG